MPSFRTKLVTRKKKAVRKASKTFRHNKKVRQNISAKKLYIKGKRFRRVARGRGFVNALRESVMNASRLGEKCPICLDPMGEEVNTTTLDCKHRFHKNCIKRLILTGHYRCPLCRDIFILSYRWEEVEKIVEEAKTMLDDANHKVKIAKNILNTQTEAHRISLIELNTAIAENETAVRSYQEAVAAKHSRASVSAAKKVAEEAKKVAEEAKKKVEKATATVGRKKLTMSVAQESLDTRNAELRTVEARVDADMEYAMEYVSYGAKERAAARAAEDTAAIDALLE